MKYTPTRIQGIAIVGTEPIVDHRGSFTRLFCERELTEMLGQRRIVQINHSLTAAVGAVRGLHYQRAPSAEMKLVRCIRGRVWDVAVDLRMGSPTFLQWHAEELSPHNSKMVVIPEGCAHGFQALQVESELLYLHTAFFDRDSEGGIRYDDPRLAIAWTLPVVDLSERDRLLPLLDSGFRGLST